MDYSDIVVDLMSGESKLADFEGNALEIIDYIDNEREEI